MISQDKYGRITSGVSILINKKLNKLAKDVGEDIREDVRKKLEETYQAEIINSYLDNSNYKHEDLLSQNAHAVIDDTVVKIVIDTDYYSNTKSTEDVYTFLTKRYNKKSKISCISIYRSN